MNKCKHPQLVLALSGGIMDLAAQNDYMPLEIMTDCAKRRYFTHSPSSLWGYHAMCVCGEWQGLWTPSVTLIARGCSAKWVPCLTHEKHGDRWPKWGTPFLACQASLWLTTCQQRDHMSLSPPIHPTGQNRLILSLVSTGTMKWGHMEVRHTEGRGL